MKYFLLLVVLFCCFCDCSCVKCLVAKSETIDCPENLCTLITYKDNTSNKITTMQGCANSITLELNNVIFKCTKVENQTIDIVPFYKGNMICCNTDLCNTDKAPQVIPTTTTQSTGNNGDGNSAEKLLKFNGMLIGLLVIIFLSV